MAKQKPVKLYDTKMKFIREFATTQECADFFNKERDYINHSLKYNTRIRKNGVWFIITR